MDRQGHLVKGYVNKKMQSLCGEFIASVLRAVQGVNGDDGRPGAPGKDGRPVRLHVITLHPLPSQMNLISGWLHFDYFSADRGLLASLVHKGFGVTQ